MQKGQDQARNDDTSVLKREIINILRSEFGNDVEGITGDKSSRGFNHKLTTRMMTPADYNEE